MDLLQDFAGQLFSAGAQQAGQLGSGYQIRSYYQSISNTHVKLPQNLNAVWFLIRDV